MSQNKKAEKPHKMGIPDNQKTGDERIELLCETPKAACLLALETFGVRNMVEHFLMAKNQRKEPQIASI